MPPKFDPLPGRNRNGDCSCSSTPLSLAPEPLMIDVIVQGCASGFANAGELGRMTDVGSPVDANVPVKVDFELQVAGLLHDIDHMVGCHPSQHGSVSADYLRRLFDEPLCELIRMHVPAKRYLIAIDSDYATRLSPESIAAMEHQGSGMTVEEQIVFENSSMARRVVALRRADEQATSPGVRTLPLAFWTDTIRALIKSPPLAVVRSIH